MGRIDVLRILSPRQFAAVCHKIAASCPIPLTHDGAEHFTSPLLTAYPIRSLHGVQSRHTRLCYWRKLLLE